MTDYAKTEFKKRQLAAGVKEINEISNQDMLRTLQEDEKREGIALLSIMSANDIFAERYGEAEIPRSALKEKIDTVYTGQISRGKKLSAMSKKKRADSAEKKIELQKHMKQEVKIFDDRRQEDEEFIQKTMSSQDAQVLQQRYTMDLEKHALRDWIIQSEDTARGEVSHIRQSLAWSEDEAYAGYIKILREVDSVPIEKFAYSSDAEFVSGYAEKYALLCKQFSAKYFLQRYDDEAKSDSANGLPLARIRARLDVIGQIKEDYEYRMALISSPYYSLLSAKDIAGYGNPDYLPDDMDQELKEYIRLYHSLEQSTVGKGPRMMEAYRSALSDRMEERRDKDVALVDGALTGITVQTDVTTPQEKEAQVRRICADIRDKTLRSLPDDNLEFIQRVEGTVGRSTVGGIDTKDIDPIEKSLGEILSTGKVQGQDIPPDVMTTFRQSFDAFCRARREMHASVGVENFLFDLQNEFFIDKYNEAFQSTDQYKKTQALQVDQEVTEEIQYEQTSIKQNFIIKLVGAFQVLKQAGLKFSKYEDRFETQRAEGMEEALKNYRLQNGANAVFPTVTIDGKVYTSYGDSEFLNARAGQTITIPEDKKAELTPLLEELDKVQTEALLARSLFREAGGEKTIVDYVYAQYSPIKIQELETKITGIMQRGSAAGNA